MGVPRGLCGGFGEADAVAELLELVDQLVAVSVGVAAAGEPVGSQVLVVAVVG